MHTPAPASAFEMRQIDSLIPYARNSRTHSPEQIAQLAASIDEFGLVGAIVVRDGTIAKGHGTLAAIRQLLEAGRSIYPAPGKAAGAVHYPDDQVPVIDASGWSDAQFKAFVIADNRLALSAGWDFEVLAVEIDELNDEGFDIDLLGFDEAELAELVGDPGDGGAPDGDGDPDTGPEKFEILVICKSERARRATLKKLAELGLECEPR